MSNRTNDSKIRCGWVPFAKSNCQFQSKDADDLFQCLSSFLEFKIFATISLFLDLFLISCSLVVVYLRRKIDIQGAEIDSIGAPLKGCSQNLVKINRKIDTVRIN